MSVRVHEKFFFDDVVIQVDDALFKVPRALLLGSPVFEQMFALPQSGPSDGDSKENPLKLEGVTVEEFGLFVRAALAQQAGATPNMTFREFNTLLRICGMWDFGELRALTIKQLTPMFADQKNAAWQYRISQDHRIAEWARPAIEALLFRADTLSEDELSAMDLRMAAKIISWRERSILHVVKRRGTDFAKFRTSDQISGL